MARAPSDPNKPKKKRAPQKPRRVFLMYKGPKLEEYKCAASAEDALDMQEQDKEWNMIRLSVPVNKKPVAAAEGQTS